MSSDTFEVESATTAVTADRPRILYLVHRIPYPPNRGDRIRSYHLLRFLAARAEVYLGFLCEQQPGDQVLGSLRPHCVDLAAVPAGGAARWARGAAWLAAGGTATEGLFYRPALARAIQGWSTERPFDLIVAFCSSMAPYLDLPATRDVPAVVDLVDVDSQKWLDYAAQCTGPRRWLYALEGARLRRRECAIARRADGVLLVSRHEAELFGSFCDADNIHAVANGVDLDYFTPSACEQEVPPSSCVFTGALDYRANLDGLRWFCGEVWPGVRRRFREATFTIVGSRPGKEARRLASAPGVELAADVPDVRPYLASASVAVAPLRVARGIQNKVLEALAMRRAVVGTPQALSGLDVQPGAHLLEALSPEEWIDAISRLLEDAALREQLGRAGRRYVETEHSWEARLRPLASILGLSGESADPATGLQLEVK
jgi:sugar transferase (PEP-CTERM/EpsH1 system associated)